MKMCALEGSLLVTPVYSDAEQMPVDTEGELKLAVKDIKDKVSQLLQCVSGFMRQN